MLKKIKNNKLFRSLLIILFVGSVCCYSAITSVESNEIVIVLDENSIDDDHCRLTFSDGVTQDFYYVKLSQINSIEVYLSASTEIVHDRSPPLV